MWNYRIIKKKDEYGLYEVFYNDSGDICAHSEKPEIIGESISDLKKTLQMMFTDLDRSKDDILERGNIKFANWEDDTTSEPQAYEFEDAEDIFGDPNIDTENPCPPGMIQVPKIDEGDPDCIEDVGF